MATSTNYGWAEPDNTSLVKDGAQAIRTLGDAIDTSLWNSGYGQAGKNKIINGGFDIWQRGTSFTPTAASFNYCADRWYEAMSSGVSGVTMSQSTDKPTGLRYSLKTQRTNGTSGTGVIYTIQAIETANSIPLAGQTVTLSMWVKKGANWSGSSYFTQVGTGTGTDQGGYPSTWTGTATPFSLTITPTTSWVRYSATGTLSSAATQVGIISQWTPSGTAGADDSLYVTGVQLEVGAKATPFQTASGGSIQGELAMCQRYYEKSYDIATNPGTATSVGSIFSSSITGAVTTSFIGGDLRYKMTKRGTPTLTFYDGAGNSGKLTRETIGGAATNNETASSANIGTNGCVVFSSGSASSSAIKFQFTADAEL
jgi:hypothetical protein